MTDAENLLFDGPFNPGYSDSEWHAGFERLKESNIYEVDFFGDMVIPAIACGLRKELLIFNTNINLPRTPVTLISPSEFGVEPNSKIPIVLAYDLSHYESLHPIDNDAIQKSIALASLIKEGNYHFSHQDLGQLVNLSLPLQQLRPPSPIERKVRIEGVPKDWPGVPSILRMFKKNKMIPVVQPKDIFFDATKRHALVTLYDQQSVDRTLMIVHGLGCGMSASMM